MISKLSQLKSMHSIIFSVWLMLLGLCGIIGGMIVHIDTSQNYFFQIASAVFKVFASFVLILVWLVIWFHLMKMTLIYEMNDSSLSS